METMGSFLDVAKFLGAFAAVILLILAFGWALKRWGGRLQGIRVSEFNDLALQVRAIDPQRKLLKIRDEEGEYLVLTGPRQDLLLRHKALKGKG